MVAGIDPSGRIRPLMCGCHRETVAKDMLAAYVSYMESRNVRVPDDPAHLGRLIELVDFWHGFGVCYQCAEPHGLPGHRCWDGDPACLEAARKIGRGRYLQTHLPDGDCICPLCRPRDAGESA